MSGQIIERLTRRRLLCTTVAAAAPALLSGPAATSAGRGTARVRLNVACIGLGGQMQRHLKEIASDPRQHLVAVCDVDEARIARSAAAAPTAMRSARVYKDFQKLLADEHGLDAVVVATPDHWHSAICTASIRAGKHVYCEKPLAHSVAEARRLRELSRRSQVVTQTGNQGSASGNLRRCIELIQAGLFGQIREVHVWHQHHSFPSGVDRPNGEDPVPTGFDWDFWLGPAPVRPFKRYYYHPFKWRGWYDFGGGSLADFCCHAFNLPVRALKLDYPTTIQVEGKSLDKESFPTACTVGYRFPKRGNLAPVLMNFYTGGAMPVAAVTTDLAATFGAVPAIGCLLVGTEGSISAGLWNTDGHMKLKPDKTFRGLNTHEAARSIPVSLPRTEGHMREWVGACLGGPRTFSDFDIGGHLTEIGLAGVLALRIGHDIAWDGRAMRVPDVPEADDLVAPEPRQGWRL